MATPRAQILVCTNEREKGATKPSCGHRGGADLYRSFKDAVKAAGLRDQVIVTRTGCLKHCSHGCIVGIWPYNLWYAGVTKQDVREVIDTTIGGNGRAVERLKLPPDAAWE